MEKFQGTWVVESSSKFNDYLKAIGVNSLKRSLANAIKPEVVITVEGNKITIQTNAMMRSMVMEANLDELFLENTPDGRVVETLFFMEEDRLVQVQKWDGKESTIFRRINEDGKFEMEMIMEDVTCKRVYVQKAR